MDSAATGAEAPKGLSSTSTRAADTSAQASSSVNIACRFFLTPGGCKREKECRYVHAQPHQVETAGLNPSTSTNTAAFNMGEERDGGASVLPPDSERPCKWMLAGYCRRGNSCWFAHNIDPKSASPSPSSWPSHQVAKELVDSSSSEARKSSVTIKSTAAIDESPGSWERGSGMAEKGGAEEEEEEDECSICTEPFHGSFGLMPNCSHVFCLPCLRKWRKNEDHDTNRKSCPVCRTVSHFVLPSNRQYKDPVEKAAALARYKATMAAVPCRNFERSKDSDRLYCPFGDDCFYSHCTFDGKQYKFGMGADEMSKPHNNRRFRSDHNIRRVTTDFFDASHSDDDYEELYQDGYDGHEYDFEDGMDHTLDMAFDAMNFGLFDFNLDGEEEEDFVGFAEEFL